MKKTGLAALLDRAGEHNPLYTLYPKMNLYALRTDMSISIGQASKTCSVSWRAMRINRRCMPTMRKRRQAPHPESHHSTTSFARSKPNSMTTLGGELPSNLRLSDSTMATILNCITELDADSLVTAEYIKSFRQKERARAKSRQQ